MCKQLNNCHWGEYNSMFTWMGKKVSITIIILFYSLYIQHGNISVCRQQKAYLSPHLSSFSIYLCVLNKAGTYTPLLTLTLAF